jgi:hypothetical protein
MSKMRIAPADRPKVKAECLRSLVTLRLDPARTELISGFVDTYLQLNAQEEQVFQGELGRLEGAEQEEIMQIVTSWMQKGIEQGEKSLILRQLERKLGTLSLTTLNQVEDLTQTQLEQLGESLHKQLPAATLSREFSEALQPVHSKSKTARNREAGL